MSVGKIFSFLGVFAIGLGAGYVFFGDQGRSALSDVSEPATRPQVAMAAGLNEADVRRIIEAYIVENPTVILQSLDDFQRNVFVHQIESQVAPYLATLQETTDVGLIGDASAEVKIIEFFDYQCPHCKANYSVLRRILDEDNTVALTPRYLPILGDGSENDMSMYAAKAAEAARLQGKFAPFHEALMASRLPISRENVAAVAAAVGLDMQRFDRDIASAGVVSAVERSRELAFEMGIAQAGTPGYIIGGKVMIGAAPDSYDQLRSMIDAARGGQ